MMWNRSLAKVQIWCRLLWHVMNANLFQQLFCCPQWSYFFVDPSEAHVAFHPWKHTMEKWCWRANRNSKVPFHLSLDLWGLSLNFHDASAICSEFASWKHRQVYIAVLRLWDEDAQHLVIFRSCTNHCILEGCSTWCYLRFDDDVPQGWWPKKPPRIGRRWHLGTERSPGGDFQTIAQLCSIFLVLTRGPLGSPDILHRHRWFISVACRPYPSSHVWRTRVIS